jgi:cbb3-type cytochrome oxidase subunit 3
LYKINPSLQTFADLPQNNTNEKKKRLPWWCIFIVYGSCIILVGISILFTIARGIEFGDLKTKQWLTSVLTGFFSSIFLTQPIKVLFISFLIRLSNVFLLQTLCLVIFFAFFCRNTKDNDEEAKEYLDENEVNFDNDMEDYLQHIEVCLFRMSDDN